jgi:hypothetical protein
VPEAAEGLTPTDAQAARQAVDDLAQCYLKAVGEYARLFRDAG